MSLNKFLLFAAPLLACACLLAACGNPSHKSDQTQAPTSPADTPAETELVTEPETDEPTTEEVTEVPTADPTPDTSKPAEGDGTTADSETEAPKGGCKSSVMVVAAVMTAMAAAVALKKKD